MTIDVRDARAAARDCPVLAPRPDHRAATDKAWAAKIAYHDVGDRVRGDLGAQHRRGLQGRRARAGAARALSAERDGRRHLGQHLLPADRTRAEAARLASIRRCRSTAAPRRPSGRASTSSDHLQVLDPPQGFMQNCNIPPDAMMPGSPFQLDRKRLLFASREYGRRRDGWTNQRGARAVELLAADDSVTAEEAMAYINDIQPFGADRWIEALRAADAARRRRTRVASRLYRGGARRAHRLGRRARRGVDAARWSTPTSASAATDLGAEKARAARRAHRRLYAVVEAAARRAARARRGERAPAGRLRSAARGGAAGRRAGSSHAVYGDRFRVGRGERSWPVGGGGEPGSEGGTTTLRNMGYSEAREDQTRWGVRGQTSTQIVVMSKPPQSWLYMPLGPERPSGVAALLGSGREGVLAAASSSRRGGCPRSSPATSSRARCWCRGSRCSGSPRDRPSAPAPPRRAPASRGRCRGGSRRERSSLSSRDRLLAAGLSHALRSIAIEQQAFESAGQRGGVACARPDDRSHPRPPAPRGRWRRSPPPRCRASSLPPRPDRTVLPRSKGPPAPRPARGRARAPPSRGGR